jgi:hypothetical protein
LIGIDREGSGRYWLTSAVNRHSRCISIIDVAVAVAAVAVAAVAVAVAAVGFLPEWCWLSP